MGSDGFTIRQMPVDAIPLIIIVVAFLLVATIFIASRFIHPKEKGFGGTGTLPAEDRIARARLEEGSAISSASRSVRQTSSIQAPAMAVGQSSSRRVASGGSIYPSRASRNVNKYGHRRRSRR